MAGSMGSAVKLATGSGLPVSEMFELVAGDIAATSEHSRSNGLTGTRSHTVERTREGLRRVAGDITLHPNADEMAIWTQRFLGAGGVLAEALPSWYASLDKEQKVMVYNGMVVGTATLSGQAGGPLTLAMHVEGISSTVNASGTFPSLTISTVPHFMFHDAVITVGGSEYKFSRWQVTIDNVLDLERFLNSQTRVTIQPKDRIVSVELDGPYGDNLALYDLGVSGAEVVATFTNGADVVTVTCVKVQFPLDEPAVNGREEIMLPLKGQAGKSGSTAEIVISITT